MAKSKSEPKPFTPEVCDRIRRLQKYITDSESARSQAFDTRDHLKNEIAELDPESPEALRLESKRNRAFDEIDRHAEGIKWARKELKKTIEKADEPALFETALEIPDFEQQLLEKARNRVEAEEEDEEAEEEDPNQRSLPLDGGAGGTDDSVENYIPGRWKDQNGNVEEILDFRRIQDLAFRNGADTEIVPRFSSSWGCSVDFVLNGSTVGSLKYSGPIPEGKPKGRAKAKGG